jgi:importin subunit alpha-2
VEQIALLCQFGAIAPLCTLLEAKEPKTILVVLDGLANILAAAEKMGELEKVSLHVEECGGLDRIEALQSHDNVEIYHKSLAILEQYFSTDVNNSFLLFLLVFFSMITTTVHIQSVCADNLTITEILEIYFDFELLFFVLI